MLLILAGWNSPGPKHQEKAIRAYERALEIDPRAPNVHYHIGLIHKDRGDIEQAAYAFERALEVDPADRDAKYWLGWLERQRQARAEAETTARKSAAAESAATMGDAGDLGGDSGEQA